jgi:hypothetical protein
LIALFSLLLCLGVFNLQWLVEYCTHITNDKRVKVDEHQWLADLDLSFRLLNACQFEDPMKQFTAEISAFAVAQK